MFKTIASILLLITSFVVADDDGILAPEPPTLLPLTEIVDNDVAMVDSSLGTLATTTSTQRINFNQVFSGSPMIYSFLILLSIAMLCVWLYTLFQMKKLSSVSEGSVGTIREKLAHKQYDDALNICKEHNTLFFKMVSSGITARRLGRQSMLDTIQAEGKRATSNLWQRISLLNDIAIIAPMVGLLGTVLGMFYAFYDLNRSVESMNTLFDGLGISVGTTVGGLLVAIASMVLYSTTKYRLVRQLVRVENEVQSLSTLIGE